MAEDIEINAKLKLDTQDADKKLGEVGKKASKSLKEVFTGKGTGLENLGKVAQGAASGIGGLVGSLSSVLQISGKVGGVIAIVMAVITVIKKLMEGTDTMQYIQKSIDSLIYTIKTALGPTIALIGEIFMTLVDMISQLIGPILKIATQRLNVVLSVILSIIQALQPFIDILSYVLNFIAEFVSSVFGMVVSATGATTRSEGVVGGYKSGLDTWATSGSDVTAGETLISETVTTQTDSLATGISSKLDEIKTFFAPLLTILQTVSTFIKSIAETILPPLQTALVAALTVVASVLNIVATTLSGISGVISSILDFFKTMISGLSSTIQNVKDGINTYIIGPINTVLQKIKGVEIFGWKPFDFISTISTFAKGGTLGAQVWGMNEMGNPEFMFNAGGHDTVINSEILSDAMYEALVRAQGTSPSRLEVSVKEGTAAGPRELAQWLLPSLKFVFK